MAIKLADTLKPMGDFPAADAVDVEITLLDETKKSIQQAYEDGDLGGGGGEVDQSYDADSPRAQAGKAVSEAISDIFLENEKATITAPVASTVTISESSNISGMFQNDKIILPSGSSIKGDKLTNMSHTFDNSISVSAGRVAIENLTAELPQDYCYANSGVTSYAPLSSNVTNVVGTYLNAGQFNAPVSIPDTITNTVQPLKVDAAFVSVVGRVTGLLKLAAFSNV